MTSSSVYYDRLPVNSENDATLKGLSYVYGVDGLEGRNHGRCGVQGPPGSPAQGGPLLPRACRTSWSGGCGAT